MATRASPYRYTCASGSRSLRMNVSASAQNKILLIGVTGATGRCALNGLLASGTNPAQLAVMTRSSASPSAQQIASMGVRVLECDLDKYDRLEAVVPGFKYIYCHALSKDAASADPQEVVRASNLARAAKAGGVDHVIYHSSGGKGCGYGISQMEQKHKVEDVLAATVPLTALQATLLMEEFWKRFTRPSVLKGSFPFTVPGTKPLQLVSAYDLGKAVAVILADPDAHKAKAYELASDEVTPLEMCKLFEEVEGIPVRQQRPPAWLFWFLNRDLYRIIKFLSERGFSADVAECRKLFPGMMTFREFLQVTDWADASKTYEDGITYNTQKQAVLSKSATEEQRLA